MIYSFFRLFFLWSTLLELTSKALELPTWNIMMQVLSDVNAYLPAPDVTMQAFNAQPNPYVCIKQRDDSAPFHVIQNPDGEATLLMQAVIKGCRTSTTRIRGWCYKDECTDAKEIQIGMYAAGEEYSVYVLDNPANKIQNTPLTIVDPGVLFNTTLAKQTLSNVPGKYLCIISPLLSSHLDKTLSAYSYLASKACLTDTATTDGKCVNACSSPQGYAINIYTKPVKSIEAFPLTYQRNDPLHITFMMTLANRNAYAYLGKTTWANFGYICFKTYDPRKVVDDGKKLGTTATNYVKFATYEFQGCRYQREPSVKAWGVCQKGCKSERLVMTIQYDEYQTVGKIKQVRIKSSLAEVPIVASAVVKPNAKQ